MYKILSLAAASLIAACGNDPAAVSDPVLAAPEAPASESADPTFASMVASADKLAGFYDLYWDEDSGKLFLAIDRFDEPFIYQDGLARGVGSNDLFLDRGQLGSTRLVRFQRIGPRAMLIEDNTSYLATTENIAERKAVEESFARSVLWGFEAVAFDGETMLVDATEFFLRDTHHLAAKLKAAEEGDYKVDTTRSAIFLPRTKAFPDNTEVEAIVTLVGEPTGKIISTVTPDPRAITVHLHHSLVRLPDAGFEPLPFDGRGGFMDPAKPFVDRVILDYAVPVGDPIVRINTLRHRLQKKEPSAAVSAPVEPIVYYVDRGAPEPIRSALIEGASWWNEAFEAAGYEDAFRVELLPEDADPMDVRYNVIQWVHRSTRGWSYGSNVNDPRTGEIIKGHVSLGSLRVRQDYLLAEGLLAPYKDETIPEEMLEFSLARIRQLSAHEVGHTIGIAHNFAASANDRASVMDYPYPYVKLDRNGDIDVTEAYDVGIGEWDKRVILYGYQDFPDDVDATAAREEILRETYASGLEFVSDTHSRSDAFATSAGPAHPRGNLWDNGADAVAELDRLMQVRKVVLGNFSERNIRMQRPMANIEDVLVPMYLIHRYQLKAAATFIGGQEFTYSMRGDGRVPVKPIPPAKQRAAVESLLATITPDALRLRPELVALIPPRSPGTPDSREIFPRRTGYVFDPFAAAATAADLTLEMLLDPARAARMINNHALDPEQPGFAELVRAVLEATWYSRAAPDEDAELRRVVDDTVLQRLMMLAANPQVQPQARAVALDQLIELDAWIGAQVSRAPADWRAHYRFASDQIRRFLANPEAMPPQTPLKAPPGSPI